MTEVQRFEDLKAWQKARNLAKEIYLVTRREPFAKDYGLARQIQTAAVSVMSNIAEGFERGTRNEFHHFLSIAKASCAEVRSQLYIALDIEHIDEPTFNQLMAIAEEAARVIGGLRASVERQREEDRAKSKAKQGRKIISTEAVTELPISLMPESLTHASYLMPHA